MPIQFDDHMLKITIDEDYSGQRVQEEAVRVWSDPSRPDEQLGRPEITVAYVPGTREIASSEVSFSGPGAADLRIRVTPLRTVYLKEAPATPTTGTGATVSTTENWSSKG